MEAAEQHSQYTNWQSRACTASNVGQGSPDMLATLLSNQPVQGLFVVKVSLTVLAHTGGATGERAASGHPIAATLHLVNHGI